MFDDDVLDVVGTDVEVVDVEVIVDETELVDVVVVV